MRCVHGTDDVVVPIDQSQGYVEAATAAGGDATLTEVEGDHFVVIDPDQRRLGAHPRAARRPRLTAADARTPRERAALPGASVVSAAISGASGLTPLVAFGGRVALDRSAPPSTGGGW